MNLRTCCIWLVESVESMMMHGLVNPKFLLQIRSAGQNRSAELHNESVKKCGWVEMFGNTLSIQNCLLNFAHTWTMRFKILSCHAPFKRADNNTYKTIILSRCSIGYMVTRLLDWRSRVRIPAGGKSIFPFPKPPDQLWHPPSLLLKGCWGSVLELKRTGRESITTRLWG
jgi:hypothetical protein